MKKVILNKCHGGFDVSEEAYKLYAKKKGLDLFIYESESYFAQKPLIKYHRVLVSTSIFPFYATKDLGESFTSDDLEEKDFSKDCGLILDDSHREDETLIEVVEELGEEASGKFGKLIVVEIPDDVAEDYVIDDYDGIETLHKRLQVW